MRRVLHIAVLLTIVGLAGCASRPAATVMVGGPNLLLGPDRETNLLARELAFRSDWPSVNAGYIFDDTSSFTTYSVDDQTFFDRQGGGYYGASESIRTGVLVR